MAHLALFVEELDLGFVEDPHTSRRVMLTEKVTVCPSCASIHSLREQDTQVRCIECEWATPAPDAAAMPNRPVRTRPAA